MASPARWVSPRAASCGKSGKRCASLPITGRISFAAEAVAVAVEVVRVGSSDVDRLLGIGDVRAVEIADDGRAGRVARLAAGAAAPPSRRAAAVGDVAIARAALAGCGSAGLCSVARADAGRRPAEA